MTEQWITEALGSLAKAEQEVEILTQQAINHATDYRMRHEPMFVWRVRFLARDFERQLGIGSDLAHTLAIRSVVLNELLVTGAFRPQ